MSKNMCSSMILMNDKSFYTLIRRFRYQYKKYHAIKDVLEEYSDKALREAYDKARNDLMHTTNCIVLMVLDGFINPDNTSLEFSQEVERFHSFGGRLGGCITTEKHFEVTVEDKELYKFVVELLKHYWND